MKRIITFIALLTLLATGLQAQIIDATNNTPKKKEKTLSNTPIYKPTGHYLRFEAGYPQFASIAYGYQVKPSIMFGGGLGFGHMYYEDSFPDTITYAKAKYAGLGIPMYAEIAFSRPNHAFSFLIDIKLGYNIQLEKDSYFDEYHEYAKGRNFFGAINVGLAYKNFSLCTGVSSNNPKWYSFLISYNLPLKVH